MVFDILRLPSASERIAPVNPRVAPFFCFLLLTAACALASFALACATPFAAFAVIAAIMLPLPSALAVTAAAWIVNQMIGFTALHYPHEWNTVIWGFAIGAATLIATAAAKFALRVLPQTNTPIALVLALVGAYAAYEIVLFAFTPFLGGSGAFTLAIVARLGLLNVLWLIGLVAVSVTWQVVGNARRRYAAN